MRRKLFADLEKHLDKKEHTVVTGARQTGKSTLLKQLESSCQSKGIPTVFLNLENKNILADLDNDPLVILKYFTVSGERIVVFIDEVQYLKDPANFLKLLYDEHAGPLKIVATGSSAFYLDDHFRDSLAGRKRVFQLLTCSFDEYLELSDRIDLLDEKRRLQRVQGAKSTRISHLKIEWEKYMLYGGYPAIITEPEPKEKVNRLKEIRDSFVKRDIQDSGVVNEAAFYNLFRIIAGQVGNQVNVNELATTLRIKNETVQNYMDIMQKCFHIRLVRPFYKNLRKELVKMPKVFMLDTGLRNCLIGNFQSPSIRPDRGELWENTYLRVLMQKYDWDEILYWRTSEGNEIDFVLPRIAHPTAIEVKYDETQKKPGKYKKFTEAYPDIPLSFAWMSPFDEDFFFRNPII